MKKVMKTTSNAADQAGWSRCRCPSKQMLVKYAAARFKWYAAVKEARRTYRKSQVLLDVAAIFEISVLPSLLASRPICWTNVYCLPLPHALQMATVAPANSAPARTYILGFSLKPGVRFMGKDLSLPEGFKLLASCSRQCLMTSIEMASWGIWRALR